MSENDLSMIELVLTHLDHCWGPPWWFDALKSVPVLILAIFEMAIWGEIGHFHLFWDTIIHRDYQEETIATWCQGSKSDITRVMINDSTLVQQIAVDKLQIVPCADFTLHSNCQLLCTPTSQAYTTISSAVRYSLVPTYILPPTPLPDFSSLNVGGTAHCTVLVLLVDL